MTPIRVAVVGVGQMGAQHVRVYSALKGVQLVGVVDADAARAAEVASTYGCSVLHGVEDLVGRVDAASVAVPSSQHAASAGFLLENGIHCLVEKPLATSETECKALIDAAEHRGLILVVGHVERFNPVVSQLAEILDGRVIHAMDARRMSAVSSRITDVDVVADLMVHDLDIVLSLMNSEVSNLFARGVHTSNSDGQDYVTALLSFANGSMATLTASRITQNKVRELQVTADLGFVTASYASQELLVHRQGERDPRKLVSAQGNYVLDLAIERVFVRAGEPLVLEVQHFIDCIAGRCSPVVSGREALDALRLVWRIQEQIAPAVARSHG